MPMNLRLAEGSQISKVCSVVLEGGVCLGNRKLSIIGLLLLLLL